MTDERTTETLVNNFDNSYKDMSTSSSCLLKTASSNVWNDKVFDSVKSFISNVESNFRKDVAFLDIEKLISRGRELLSINIFEIQTKANDAIMEANQAIDWKVGDENVC